MNRFSKLAQAGTVFAGLAVLPLLAQPTTPAPNPDMPRATDVDRTTDMEDDLNFGWLGLLGLAGLAGMARKRHAPTDHVHTDMRSGHDDVTRDRI